MTSRNRNGLIAGRVILMALIVFPAALAAGPGPHPSGEAAANRQAVLSAPIDLISTGPAKLTAADPGEDDNFGYSVAVSGDTAVVGALQDDDSGENSGAAYVFERDPGGPGSWAQAKKLVAGDAGAGDIFGISVAISGDTIVVGAPQDDDGGSASGSVYVFERDFGGPGNWGQAKKLTASDPAADDLFGDAVAISGNTIVVGSYQDDDGGSASGSVYVFERDLGGAQNWGQASKLVASDASAHDVFGSAVAISTSTIVIGAWGDNVGASGTGSAYVFVRDLGGPDNWGEAKKLSASDAATNDRFGISVGIHGDTIAVGADLDDDQGTDSGSAYVFERNLGGADNWGQAKKLTAGDGARDDRFGWSIAVSGDRIASGAPLDGEAGFFFGSAYEFARDQGGAGNWGQAGKLVAGDAEPFDLFGYSIAIDGDTIVIGAISDDDGGADAGSAYVFVPEPPLQFVFLPVIISDQPAPR